MYDVVLFGATGFTGGLTAAYLAAHAPEGTRWALAGRNRAKLAAVRERLAAISPAAGALDLLVADVADDRSLRAVAESARVVATTVGPYVEHGDGLVAACARAGTDYVDLCGEPEFVDRTYLRHHSTAVASGARLVHSCGFDSIPYDLGAYFTVRRLPEGVPISLEGFVSASATFSGGTFHSAVTAFSRLRSSADAARERRRAEGRPAGRVVRGRVGPPRYDRRVGAWVLPAPTIDPQVVLRSAAALDRYGPDFRYRHHIAVRRLPVAAGLVGGVGALVALAQLPPARKWLLERRKPGEGPSAAERARSWFRVRFFGEGGGQRVVTEVSGGDPGYDETAKMLGESALCLAFDHLPETRGQVTTAVAMGDALTSRLVAAGIRFEVR
ncbi:saccharopine dehydrogenase NADP-binding domain-containing protein [Actinosynnema sp. NPDC047251]|uniref:Saccharopine dehydrogenase (NAD(+),L-glutamate-forming) n=1 Tax=Saccharothrix espanaensis (strain ATCC 51144 / DSM 44229 / JCM 9112 / NBRC 15066 / NRRL 15764) TaxID=1179773 RepID=K0JX78_SACES|nr:saccharopine dehydrogenase NADP-binding domain-containing protein [Saccharothrix espanaensis]CCH29977.1 Saccharopine dehydrogenase (NAD(+),L-glutamate-forming) [Saccharothrix espanaensis DSM 44229]